MYYNHVHSSSTSRVAWIVGGSVLGTGYPWIPLTDDDTVFGHFDGKPLLPHTVTHAWIKLVRHIDLKPIRLHDTRYTHTSLMLKQSIHPKIVQERLVP